MRKRSWLWILVGIAGIVVVMPSYVRAYRVAGASDAPTYLVGDRILVNKAAYDFKLPYTGIVLLSHSDPEPGDVVMFRTPDDDIPVFKRVVGCPGETVAMDDQRLEVNGSPLRYEPVDDAPYRDVAERNHLGRVIETESGHGPTHLITHTPGACSTGSFDPVTVPPGRYFMVGDNRGNSKDSRDYGPIPRDLIIGKVVYPSGSVP